MTTFAIDSDNTITAYLSGDAIPEDHARFASEKDLAKLAAQWPADRLVEIWNGFAGVPPFGDLKPVKRFTDRKTAVARIWRAIQALVPAASPQASKDAPKQAKPTKDATRPTDPREGSKKAIVLELLRRPEGATLADIMAATGWHAHSVRGFLSGSLGKKMGLKITRAKRDDGTSVYFLAE